MMQTFNILQSKSKIDYSLEALYKCYQIVWNYNYLFLIIDFAKFKPEIKVFLKREKNNITKFGFLLVTLSKINTLCLGDETKSGEKQR